MELNIQIIPAPAGAPPLGGKIVQLPAREGQGMELACQLCSGTGVLPRHGDSCRKCGGTGKARFVEALRISVDAGRIEERRAELEAILDALPSSARVQCTIHLSERGGGLTNTGHATVIAGMHGEPLRGFGGSSRCGDDHAHFYVRSALVISYGHHRGQGCGTVTLVGVDCKARHHLGIVKTPIFKFEDGEHTEVCQEARDAGISWDIDFPVEAVKAARAKARCYHCRSAFYTADGGASGPSGALRGAGAACGGLPSPLKGPGIGYDPT